MKESIVISRERRLEMVKEMLRAGRPLDTDAADLLAAGQAQAAVEKDWLALAHIEKQTEAMCVAACKQNGWALEIVDEQTPAICLAAVQENGMTIQYVHDKTDTIANAALANNPLAIRHIETKNPVVSESTASRLGALEKSLLQPTSTATPLLM